MKKDDFACLYDGIFSFMQFEYDPPGVIRHSRTVPFITGVDRLSGARGYRLSATDGTTVYRPTEIEAFRNIFLKQRFAELMQNDPYDTYIPYTSIADTVVDAFLQLAGMDTFAAGEVADLHALRVREIADRLLDSRGRGLGRDPETRKTSKTYSAEQIAEFANWHAKHDFTVTVAMVREAQSLKKGKQNYERI